MHTDKTLLCQSKGIDREEPPVEYSLGEGFSHSLEIWPRSSSPRECSANAGFAGLRMTPEEGKFIPINPSRVIPNEVRNLGWNDKW